MDVRKTNGVGWGYYLVDVTADFGSNNGDDALGVYDEADFAQTTGGVLLDSGTTEILLPSAILGRIGEAGTLLELLYAG